MIDKHTMLSICTAFGIEIAKEIEDNQKMKELLKKLVVIYENISEPTKGTDDYKQGTQDMLEKVIDDIKKIIGENNGKTRR